MKMFKFFFFFLFTHSLMKVHSHLFVDLFKTRKKFDILSKFFNNPLRVSCKQEE